MIQRIQSLFLLLSSASFWTIFGFPFASSNEATSSFLSDKIYDLNDHILILILTVLGGLVALGAVFLYKNRTLQIRLTYLTLVLAIVLPLTVIMLFYSEATKNYLSIHIEDGFGIYLPIIAIVSSILAIRFIKKDDKLIKSMDRLR